MDRHEFGFPLSLDKIKTKTFSAGHEGSGYCVVIGMNIALILYKQ
jgi:hypothetical protein